MIFNRYAGTCFSCGSNVPEGKGWAFKDGSDRWRVSCTRESCMRTAKGGASPPPHSSNGKEPGTGNLNLDLLIKLLKLTTSSNDAEALLAMRKANEQVAKLGEKADWETLLRGKVTVMADPFASVKAAPPVGRTAPPPRPPAPPPAPKPPPPPPTCVACGKVYHSHTFGIYCSSTCKEANRYFTMPPKSRQKNPTLDNL